MYLLTPADEESAIAKPRNLKFQAEGSGLLGSQDRLARRAPPRYLASEEYWKIFARDLSLVRVVSYNSVRTVSFFENGANNTHFLAVAYESGIYVHMSAELGTSHESCVEEEAYSTECELRIGPERATLPDGLLSPALGDLATRDTRRTLTNTSKDAVFYVTSAGPSTW
eukprot:gene3166-4009_t